MKMLIVGNVPTTDHRSIGGATTLLKSYLEYLDDVNLSYEHIQIRTYWFSLGMLVSLIPFLMKFIFKYRRFELISFHATRDFSLLNGWLCVILSKLAGKTISYHVFGGSLHDYYAEARGIRRKILNVILNNTDYFYVETKSMHKYFSSLNINAKVIWLPNCRKNTNVTNNTTYNKKFVFISRVTKTKGILDAIETFSELNKDFYLDVYGPLDDDLSSDIFLKYKNIEYKGVLNPNDVSTVLSSYNFLVLPTYHKGEGYPGIIIESLSVGTPVITTIWNSLSDLVTNEYNGYLHAPKDTEKMRMILEGIDNNKFEKLRVNALKSFEGFNSDVVFRKLTHKKA